MSQLMKDHAGTVRQLSFLDPDQDIQRDVNPHHVDAVWRDRQAEQALRNRNQRRARLGLAPTNTPTDRFNAGLYGA